MALILLMIKLLMVLLCVDVDMVHTEYDLVNLDMHVKPPLLQPNFGLLSGGDPYFLVIDVDSSRVLLQKIIFNIWVNRRWRDWMIHVSASYHYSTCDYFWVPWIG